MTGLNQGTQIILHFRVRADKASVEPGKRSAAPCYSLAKESINSKRSLGIVPASARQPQLLYAAMCRFGHKF
ncbi:hypothetical protein A3841_17270 [Pontibacter flavimaris]|uniref:Uncharacterized protein n=1 Tax=Pontibacter flavimaris TaxID=1797110 RepID=A0A1Q5PD47_9BACT|nr:hypothetical protein A3841_17270 [Pontibacter flavimaris]